MKTLPLTYRDYFTPQDLEGFSPQISRLVYGLEYVRANTLFAVQGLTTAQLDTQVLPGGNTTGMLLAHFAGTESGYQQLTFQGNENGFKRPENLLGAAGLRERDDDWLAHTFRPWDWTFDVSPQWCWFHVIEDELRHQGQIAILRKELERREQA
ncbi:hypothetical protein Deipr_2124 (plasmid) [Deinococcus proteolyticus MRP]|uniref:DinB family protein n=1 Tax=Deinococcus proteolyticus (strain ATCC 35074 / DSM 20540 / JCM 6276 / NBRC 101906 / NCIMB 13154 / VKM Ac-1939 / CCM 2703 / MRP) TaxID=693977 RepID=F0RPE8_DEIPM|nr:DUF664 domain-containing protein [Deinococcus proteolyticus]ADY27254.1 hypothetical protein Deipr_2124 [Deinococcus proteolyticus MRP]